jgi:hypothetical protein
MGKPTFIWRRRRLGAVIEYERRFEEVPQLFKGHKLPNLRSYYVIDGKYIWPSNEIK